MTADFMEPNAEHGKPVVFEQNGKVFANSTDVAAFFGKSHAHVMRDIRNLIEDSEGACRSNFGPTSREVAQPNGGTRLEPSYDMDRSGFSLLAMGFTGRQAIKFKLRYVSAFERMEEALHGRLAGPAEPEALPPPNGEFPNWSPEAWRLKLATANMYDRAHGKLVMAWMMRQLGFPVPPRAILRAGQQMEMFETDDMGPDGETIFAAATNGTGVGNA